MKIGILTYHWAANYGAVLQCYALQTFLEELGHSIYVINYKPRINDDSLYSFFKYKKYIHLRTYLNKYLQNRKRENSLAFFREEKLKLTRRLYSYFDIPQAITEFDIVISGSDQVLNPTFLMHGEGKNTITPTYYLGFPFKGKKVGYALSFGCTSYPQEELVIASKYIDGFDFIGVRENSGIGIVATMGRYDAVVTPDPTLLRPASFYHQLADEGTFRFESNYIYSFFIRNIDERKSVINSVLNDSLVLWNNDDNNYSLQSWLSRIKYSKFVVTDSFHCMVMCLKLHVPFAVVTEQKGRVDMNDRFYTLLEKMQLADVIVYKADVECLSNISIINFDWDKIDEVLESFIILGEKFLARAIS